MGCAGEVHALDNHGPAACEMDEELGEFHLRADNIMQ